MSDYSRAGWRAPDAETLRPVDEQARRELEERPRRFDPWRLARQPTRAELEAAETERLR